MAAAYSSVPYRLLSACLLILGTRVAPLTAVNPCELSDGSGGIQLDLSFTESYGRGDHLAPTHGEERSLGQIYGTVRHVNDTNAAGADTVVLRPLDVPHENKFCNKTEFNPVEIFFAGVAIRSGTAYMKLRRGIDRERLDIYIAGMPGVTVADASIMFTIECTPDAPTFSARNFSVRVRINDLNDNSPAFYNATGGSRSLTGCQQSDSLELGNFTVIVRQNTPRGVLLFSGAVARDRDEALNAATRVSLQPNPYFEAAAGAELRIYTKRQVYYDSFDAPGGVTMRLLAVAEDSPANASLRRSSTATITFTIVDEEDQPPVFAVPGCQMFKSLCVNPAYSATVISGVKTTGPLSIAPGPIQAVTRDARQYNISYSLLAAGDDDLHKLSFWIDRDTGLVTQLQPIDRQVTLVVKATKWTEQSKNLLSERYCVALLVVSVDDTSNSSTMAIASTEDSDFTTAAPQINQPLVSALITVCGVQTLVIAIVMLLIIRLVACRKQKPTATPDQPPAKAEMDQNPKAEDRNQQPSSPAPPPNDQGNNNSPHWDASEVLDGHSIANDLESSEDNSKHRDFAQQNSIADKDEDEDKTGEALMLM